MSAERSRVWRILKRLPEWDQLLPTVDEVHRSGESGPVGVGSTFRLRQPGLPQAEYVVTDWQPEVGFTWESMATGVRTIATHELRESGTGTDLRLTLEWYGPLAGLVRFLVSARARRLVTGEAEAFTQLVEQQMGVTRGRCSPPPA